jgi:hypothetical protein
MATQIATGYSRAMSRNALYAVIAVLVLGIGVAGFAYYQHKQNTLLEVNVGSHQLSVQKN